MKRFVPEKKFRYKSEDSGKVYFFALVAILGLNLIFSLIADGIARQSSDSTVALKEIYSSTLFNSLFGVCSLVALLTVFFLHLKIENYSISASKLNKKLDWKTILICIAIGFIALFGLQYLTGIFEDVLKLVKFPFSSATTNVSNFGYYILAVIILCVVPAIGEEIIFRGVILNGLTNRYQKWGAIALTSLMFAIFHMNLQQVFYQFLLGMIMGWVVIKTGSLLASMIVHFTSNFIVVTCEFIHVKTGFSFELAHTWWFYILALVLAGLTFALLYLIEKFYFGKKKQQCQTTEVSESQNKEEKPSDVSDHEVKTSGYVWLGLIVAVTILVVGTVSSYLAG